MTIESSNEPAAFQSFEHEGWQTVGRGYAKHFAGLTNQLAPSMLAAAAVSPGMRVLDVCTGPGMLASAAVTRGADVIGIDLSSTMVNLARENVPEAAFEEADAQALPFEDESFDAVICGLGVIHVPEPAKALSEIRRVLRQDGYASISTWGAPSPTNGFGLVFSALKAHGNLDVALPHGPDMFQFSQEASMDSALSETGFRDVAVKTVNLLWEHNEPDGIMTALVKGSVRSRALLAAQTAEERASIFEAARAAMAHYASDRGYRVPMSFVIGRGCK
jgi:ubiquinone/menaquinone biosynthesis C-methylase UbiE